MNVEIVGRHIVVTPALRSYVLRRLRRFARILGEDTSFHVIVDVEKDRHIAEVVMKSKLLDLTGRGRTDDMYASILVAIEKLEKQVLKQKSKRVETKRQRAKAKSVAQKSTTREPRVPAPADGIVEEETQTKPMDVEEAVLELGQSEYPFVVFRNSESGDLNVLYRRKDGALGLILA
jgi:putative sigma-54 modulation protein